MKNRKLYFTILYFFALNSTFAQLKVFSNNKVQVGPLWTTTAPTEQFYLNGGTYINCFPATSGLSIVNYNNTLASGATFDEPAILPQWANSAWLGIPTRQFFRIYSRELYANLGLLIASDSNLKTNIVPISSDSAISKITRMKGYNYDYKLTYADSLSDSKKLRLIEDNKNQIGLLAQDLKNIVPEAVKLDEQTGNYSINYIMLIPLLIESIKKQQEQILLLQQNVQYLITR